MTPLQTEANVVKLDRAQCLSLISAQQVGRLAVAVAGDGPLVVPVNYILDGECIVFRSDPGTKLRALNHSIVSFEIDFFDWYHRTGWSVLVRGAAYEATHWEVDRLLLQPWAAGDKRHWVRLPVTQITGRRVDNVESEWPADNRGYL